MKILLVGGGTLGPVSPLLAVKDELLRLGLGWKFIFYGTRQGPEKNFIKGQNLSFYSIPAGKWRRFFSLLNFTDLFVTFFGFIKAMFLLHTHRPKLMFSAGGFVSVPVAYAAFLYRIPIIVHQQDILPTLSNKLIAPIAKKITVSFDISQKDFPSASGLLKTKNTQKIIITGNPVRKEIATGKISTAQKIFNLEPEFPTLLVLGGSQGASSLNQLIWKALPTLTQTFQIIHSTGKGKLIHQSENPRYHPYEFLGREEAKHALKKADIVVSRAGLATISELSLCRKVCVLLPLYNSHQVQNAQYLFFRKAAIYAKSDISPEAFVSGLKKLLFDHELRTTLSSNISKIMPHNGAWRIANIIINLLK